MYFSSLKPVQAFGAWWQQLFGPSPYALSEEAVPGRESSCSTLSCVSLAAATALKCAARRLAKTPWFTCVVVFILAVGIGSNMTVFSFVSALLLNPLPSGNVRGIVHLTSRDWNQNNSAGCLSYGHFELLRNQTGAINAVAGYASDTLTLIDRGEATQLQAARVSPNFFDLLSVKPYLGRTFQREENLPGRDLVVLLSYPFWQRHFHSDPKVIGTPVDLDGKQYTVIGILPIHFAFGLVGERTDVWAPSLVAVAFLTPQQIQAGSCYINAVARITPGHTLEQAKANLGVAEQNFLRANAHLGDADPKRALEVIPLASKLVANYRLMLLVFQIAVFLFLIVACANVAGLLLARAIERRREMAIRIALGATRVHVFAEVVVESLLLSLIGGFFALALSFVASHALSEGLYESIPRLRDLHLGITWSAFGICAALSLLTAVLCSAIPAWQLWSTNLSVNLKELGRGTLGSRTQNFLRNALVVGQLATAVILLVVSGLLLHSLARVQNQSLGFEPNGVLSLLVPLQPAAYSRPQQIVNASRRLLSVIESLPGVESAAVATALPVNESRLGHFLAEGQPPVPLALRRIAAVQSLSSQYLHVMGIPLLEGRFFSNGDLSDSTPVAVVNQAFARKFFPSQTPVGKHIWMGKSPQQIQIVGVIGDVKNVSLASPVQAEVDFPLPQLPSQQLIILCKARTANALGLAQSVRDQIASADSQQPVTEIRTLGDVIADSYSQSRLVSGVLSAFASLALVLATVGIYSVVSYNTARQSTEFGLRMAVGATRLDLVRGVVRKNLWVIGAGILFGLIGAALAAGLVSRLTYEVNRFDPVSFLGGPFLLFALCLIATLVPVLRTSRVVPADVLRAE